jgi:hypothetical protein
MVPFIIGGLLLGSVTITLILGWGTSSRCPFCLSGSGHRATVDRFTSALVTEILEQRCPWFLLGVLSSIMYVGHSRVH